MNSQTGFVHDIDPVLLFVGPVPLYWYGLAYSLGFTGLLVWFWLRRQRLGLAECEPYELCILIALGILLGARTFEIVVYEWDYYRMHPAMLLSYWRGGMASHGVLIGCALAIWAFCRWRRHSFLLISDEVAIPGAIFLALGRIGNFINGQIAGYPTEVWWGVQFPDLEGFRHPVALYESLKNLAIVPILLIVSRRHPAGRGMLLAHFVFWYGFLRLFSDYFREYGADFLGIGRGQYFNLMMAVIGLALMAWMKRHSALHTAPEISAARQTSSSSGSALRMRQLLFAALALFCLVIPSSWTQGVLKEYRDSEPEVRLTRGAIAVRLTSRASPIQNRDACDREKFS